MSTGNWQPVRLLDVPPLPNKGVEADDPLEVVGVPYPTDPGADRFTAQCIVEEYALIGFGADEIRILFTSPNYVALHRLFRRYGEAFVDESIAAVFVEGGKS
jgi:hypothetical protein